MAESESNNNDSTISQFLSFTGSTDTNVATQYLEMSGNNLEMAVSLWMDHNGGAGGGAGGMGGGMGGTNAGNQAGGGSIMAESDAAMAARLAQQDEVRAPDATRTMRLLGGDSPSSRGGGARLPMGMAGLPPGMGAFADPTRDIPPHLLAAMGGPAAREMMMRNMMMMEGGDATLGSMGSNWASSSGGGGNNAAAAAAGGGGGGSR